jgi:hypothetical protein
MVLRKFVADFETIVPGEEEENPVTRVWNWGVTEIGDPSSFDWGTDIDGFMDWCFYRKGNILVYFHNLRFDGEFIFHWLFEHGFEYSDKKEPNTFSALITKMGQFYAIEVIWDKKIVYDKNRKYTRLKKTTFYDSLKKLPFPVETIAKAFKLPMQKGEIDYKKDRPFGYIPTQVELDYLKNDVQIVAAALETQFNQDLTYMTVASDALHYFKQLHDDEFKTTFPVVPMLVDDHIRYAYRGGFTYVNPKFQDQDIEEGVVFDRNSAYPATMYNRPLPHGAPLWFSGKYEDDDLYTLFIQELYCTFQLKPGHIPTIQIKTGRFQENQYLENNIDELGNDEPATLYMTNMDLELFFEHYDVNVMEWRGGFMFRECTGVFRAYIDYWMKVKEENAKEKNALYTLAKLMLNSLYGKFASSCDVTGKIPYIKEGEEHISYKLGEEKYKDPVYTAMGVFITSWTRYDIIKSAQTVYDRFLYADTDSLHLKGTDIPDSLDIHFSRLGAWKHESTFRRARFIRQKTYVEDICYKHDENGKKVDAGIHDYTFTELHVTCAGMPDSVKEKVTWDNFHVGFTSGGKLLPKHIKGGLVLVDSDFTLKGSKKEKEMDMEQLYKKILAAADYDYIKEGIKILGHLETCKPGDVFYHQYKELSRSVKMMYFRKRGVPVDVFATEMNLDINELFEQLRR